MTLTIKPPRRPSTTTAPSTTESPLSYAPTDNEHNHDRSSSPIPPPTSPLTPVVPHAALATYGEVTMPGDGHSGGVQAEGEVAQPAFKPVFREPEYITQPPSVPFELDDNTDAIALRAAISSLQMQRQRAQEDMRQLQRVKREAVAHPEEWRRGLLDRYARKRRAGQGRPEGKSPGMEDEGEDARAGAQVEGMDVDGNGEVEGQHVLEVPETQQSGGWPSFSSSTGSHTAPPPADLDHDHDRFQTPSMQNVVRMPPINWAKYHIIGEPLERMHRVQQSRPSDGLGGEGRATIAAPYSPFTDSLDSGQHSPRDVGDRKDSGCNAAEMLHPMQTRWGSRMLGG